MWDKFSQKEKSAQLIKLLRRNMSTWLAFPDVIDAGIGFKFREGKQSDQLTIIFSVKEKRDTPEHLLPGFLKSVVTQNGQRKRVTIPTDVVVATDQILQNGRMGLQAGERCIISKRGGFEAKGAITACLVDIRNHNVQYFLGCQHVFAISTERSLPKKSEYSSYELFERNKKRAKLSKIFPSRGADAALAFISEPNSFDGAVGTSEYHFPESYIGLQEVLGNKNSHYEIMTPSGSQAIKFLEYGSRSFSGYAGRGRVQYRNLLKYEFSSGATKVGDSGSPILNSEKQLVAMHIGFGRDHKTGKTVGFAHPVEIFFRKWPYLRLKNSNDY
jgi:hypothetical protein